MSTTEFQELIFNVQSDVKDTEAKVEKHSVPTEEEINEVLDLIISFKNNLVESTTAIERITEDLEKISWYEINDSVVLQKMIEFLSNCKSLRKTLIKKYLSFAELRADGIARDEIRQYKNAVDVFTEVYTDLEFIFIKSPIDIEFCDITSQLENL